MTDLPAWFTAAAVGWGTAMGAAVASLWFGLWPLHDPNILAFAGLCGAIAFVGVVDTFRALTKRPMDPTLAVAELVVTGALIAVITPHFVQFLISAVLVALVRGQVGALTRVIVDLYDSGRQDVARRTRGRFTTVMLVTGGLVTAFVLFSSLDRSASLFAWRTAPIVLLAAVAGLVLVSGAEYEVMRSRFHGGQVTTDESFGTGWWGPVGGLIAAVVIVSAIVPAPPAVISLQEVGQAVAWTSYHTVPNGKGNEHVGTTSVGKTGGLKITTGVQIAPAGPSPGLFIFLGLLAALVVTLAIRSVRYSRQLGVDTFELVMRYVRSVGALVWSTVSFFVGFVQLLLEGLAGDWSGMKRFLRRWWLWILDVITGRIFRNIWRQLGIRSADHKAGEEFAAEARARTMAGAAWNLPPGDPRRKIRELYRQFMQEAKDAGLGRRPSQTPRTFQLMVQTAEPATVEGLGQLTGAYEWARFSHHPVTTDHIGRASSGWEGIKGYLVRRREKFRAASAGLKAGERRGGVSADGQAEEGMTVKVRERGPRRI